MVGRPWALKTLEGGTWEVEVEEDILAVEQEEEVAGILVREQEQEVAGISELEEEVGEDILVVALVSVCCYPRS